jgi:hypothetical protein
VPAGRPQIACVGDLYQYLSRSDELGGRISFLSNRVEEKEWWNKYQNRQDGSRPRSDVRPADAQLMPGAAPVWLPASSPPAFLVARLRGCEVLTGFVLMVAASGRPTSRCAPRAAGTPPLAPLSAAKARPDHDNERCAHRQSVGADQDFPEAPDDGVWSNRRGGGKRQGVDAGVRGVRGELERVLQSYGLRRTGNDDLTLSLRLAIDLHPGFKVVDINAPKPYQHRRGNPVTLMMLIADVETVKREKLPRACSDSEAVRILASSQRFASRWGDFRRRVRTLKNWLSEAHDPAMNPMLPIWRLAEAGRQLPAMIEVFGSVRGRHHEN